MKTINDLLRALWVHYTSGNPQAAKIHALLSSRGDKIVNDHIAFRTFNLPTVGIDILARNFEDFGYQAKGEYVFEAKKLYAKHYEHVDTNLPRIFISELRVELFDPALQTMIKKLVGQVPAKALKAWDFVASGRLWERIKIDEYKTLREASEYAAWLACFGFCANHFTVSVNALDSVEDLKSLNTLLVEAGFKMNDAGGMIKGSPEVYLEQSSTMASPVLVDFAEGKMEVPYCYYEFAQRYPMPDGKLFSGFVATSADKIFESTDRQDA